MKHIIFEENASYKTAILIKEAALDSLELTKRYVLPSNSKLEDVIGFSLKYKDNDKAPASFCREYLSKLLPAIDSLKVTTLFVCDANYFKYLTKVRKLAGTAGYVLDCAIENYTHMKVIMCPNYKGLFFNPDIQSQIDLAVKTLDNHTNGIHIELGSNIIHSANYPDRSEDIRLVLLNLHQYPELSCDVETFSLKFYGTGIATIAFAWDKHNGTAFRVELGRQLECDEIILSNVKRCLREFFEAYKGKLTYQNANFDLKIIISDLFMDNTLDQIGMLNGIEVMTKSIDDTKIISYLATNSTSGNTLGLKYQAHEFAGNYAEDVQDITSIPYQDLLTYNLKDCLATNYVKEKNYPIMVKDSQLGIYNSIFIPSIKVILQMELTGMPIDMPEVYKAQHELSRICKTANRSIHGNPIITKHLVSLRYEEFLSKNIEWVKKRMPLEHFDYVEFNPASNQQLQELLYVRLELPVMDRTKTKQPAVGGKTLKKLLHKTEDADILDLLGNLIALAEAKKILDTFIRAFLENSILKSDGIWYLHGNFNLGGTVSGRLSSSKPNLQNIPSGSKYAKLIKKCFIAPPGYLFCGADFDSLEDKISALTTRDPNKLKVYEDLYDGHCLRAFSYFGDSMPDIVDTVDSINSIAIKYPELRQDSKAPTFALTYLGMWKTLVNNLGWTEEKAKSVEASYHELYNIADEWVQDRLIEASSVGFITTAFGLRVRTPILKQTLIGKKSTPFEAEAEARTAGNALGQGWGMLNNRAGIEFQQRVLASKYALDIKPTAQIHDALYFIVKNNMGCVKWFNDNLPDCMSWQKLPEIQHDTVKLSGSVGIFYPNWCTEVTLPNQATKQEILELCQVSD